MSDHLSVHGRPLRDAITDFIRVFEEGEDSLFYGTVAYEGFLYDAGEVWKQIRLRLVREELGAAVQALGPKPCGYTMREDILFGLKRVLTCLDGAAPTAEPPALDDEAVAILRFLSKRRNLLLTVDQIEHSTQFSRKVVVNRLTYLIGAGLAQRPQGKKRGCTITTAGIRLADQFASRP
jgi:hypothetical protein